MTVKRDRTEERRARENAARIRFAGKIVDFFRSIVSKDNKLLHHTIGDFSVYFKKSRSTFGGGNTMKIWYHPGKPFAGELPAVLGVWWQFDSEQCRLDTFDSDRQWQLAIERAIERDAQARRITAAPAKKEKVLTKYEEEMRELHRAEKDKRLAKQFARWKPI